MGLMSALPPRILAKYHVTPPESFLKAQANTVALTFKILPAYPMRDIAGEYVRPEGCNFKPHHADPCIDLEHRRHPIVKGMPVAWARASLSKPGAPYAVEMVKLNFAADGKPPLWHTVPVGTEYYDKSCKISMQVFAMRESGDLPAASLEFSPVSGHVKALGTWNHLDNREACDFDAVDVHRWTACERGVNPGALLVLDKSLNRGSQVPSPLERILKDKRVNVGGQWEPLHGYILKALAPADTPKRTTVTVERKAMEPDTMAAPAPDATLETESAAAVDEMAGDDGVAHNGVTAIYSAGQTCEACADQCEADLENTDNPELYRDAMKLVAMQRALGEKWKALGDKHDAKIQAMKGGKESPAESEDTATDTSKDEDGTYKAVRRAYKPVLKAVHEHNVKRFRLSDLQATEPVAKATETAAEPETLEQALERIRREDPEGWRRIQREQNLIDACS